MKVHYSTLYMRWIKVEAFNHMICRYSNHCFEWTNLLWRPFVMLYSNKPRWVLFGQWSIWMGCTWLCSCCMTQVLGYKGFPILGWHPNFDVVNPLTPTRMHRNQLRGYESSWQKMAILCIVDSLRYILLNSWVQAMILRVSSVENKPALLRM